MNYSIAIHHWNGEWFEYLRTEYAKTFEEAEQIKLRNARWGLKCYISRTAESKGERDER